MSIGSTPIEIEFKKGVNIITGTNKDKTDRRNGVGKSSIADAIYFALFGNILRDVKKEAIKNDSSKGECRVEMHLDVALEASTQSIIIIRTLDPSTVLLYVDGVDKTRDSIANTTDAICTLIGCNSEVFENCVVMTLNSALPFMGRKKQDKRKFIESIFNLEIFSRMLKDAKEEYSTCKAGLDVVNGRYDEISISLQTIANQQQTAKTAKEQKINQLRRRVETLEATKAQYEAQRNALDSTDAEQIRKLKKLIDQILPEQEKNLQTILNEESSKVAEYQGLLRSIKATIAKMDANVDDCPVCLRHITEDVRNHVNAEKANALKLQAEYNVKIQEYQAKVNRATDNLRDIVAARGRAQIRINGWNSREDTKANIERQIQATVKDIADTNQAIADVIAEQAPFDVLVQQQQAKLAEAVTKRQGYTDKLNLLNQVKFVFSEEGVKSVIVKRILNIFNAQLAYYLQKLDANCTCVFDEYFEETIVNDKGKTYSYHSLSGAEKKSIDLACLFTFMDIRRLQGDVAFNISLFDELLDSSLDVKGVELVVDVLKDRVEKFNECVYVISHRKESAKLATGEVVYLVKSNGTTTRVDFIDAPH